RAARIDRESDRAAAETNRVAHARGERRRWRAWIAEQVAVVHLQDQRQRSRELVRDDLQLTERRRIRVAPALHREARVIEGIVAGRVRLERSAGAVLEA